MGFPSPDHFLALITAEQWREWQTWVAIRGPIGGPRQDFYTALIAMQAGGPYGDKKVTTGDFRMPWDKDFEEPVERFGEE